MVTASSTSISTGSRLRKRPLNYSKPKLRKLPWPVSKVTMLHLLKEKLRSQRLSKLVTIVPLQPLRPILLLRKEMGKVPTRHLKRYLMATMQLAKSMLNQKTTS